MSVTSVVVKSHLAYVIQLKHLLKALEAPLNLLLKVCLPILILVRLVWKEAKRLDGFDVINIALPLWHNNLCPHMLKLTDSTFWEHRGLTLLADIYNGDVLASLTDLRRKYDLPRAVFYWYLQFATPCKPNLGLMHPGSQTTP